MEVLELLGPPGALLGRSWGSFCLPGRSFGSCLDDFGDLFGSSPPEARKKVTGMLFLEDSQAV